MVIGMMPMTIAASLSITDNKIDIDDKQVGPYTLKYLEVYLQGSYAPVSIISAEQNDTTIKIGAQTPIFYRLLFRTPQKYPIFRAL